MRYYIHLLGIFFGEGVNVASKLPLHFLRASHSASSIFVRTFNSYIIHIPSTKFQIYCFELIENSRALESVRTNSNSRINNSNDPSIDRDLLYTNSKDYHRQIEIAWITWQIKSSRLHCFSFYRIETRNKRHGSNNLFLSVLYGIVLFFNDYSVYKTSYTI